MIQPKDRSTQEGQIFPISSTGVFQIADRLFRITQFVGQTRRTGVRKRDYQLHEITNHEPRYISGLYAISEDTLRGDCLRSGYKHPFHIQFNDLDTKQPTIRAFGLIFALGIPESNIGGCSGSKTVDMQRDEQQQIEGIKIASD